MTNQDGFYKLWQAVSGLSGLEDFPFDNLNEEDFILAEAMTGEGLTRLMYFKTHLANAKHKLQASDLQRGVLPQTEEGKESVCAETDTDKEKTERLIKEFRSQPLQVLLRDKEVNDRNYPKLHGYGASYIQDNSEEDKADCGKTKGTTFRLQGFEEGFFGAIPNLRCEDIRMPSGSNGDTPHERSGE